MGSALLHCVDGVQIATALGCDGDLLTDVRQVLQVCEKHEGRGQGRGTGVGTGTGSKISQISPAWGLLHYGSVICIQFSWHGCFVIYCLRAVFHTYQDVGFPLSRHLFTHWSVYVYTTSRLITGGLESTATPPLTDVSVNNGLLWPSLTDHLTPGIEDSTFILCVCAWVSVSVYFEWTHTQTHIH